MKNADPLDVVAFLEGRWVSASGSMRHEEHWMAPLGGTIIGMNRVVEDGRTVVFEYLRIVVQGKDVVLLTNFNGGHPPDACLLVKSGPMVAVFSSQEHGSMTYWRDGATLHARGEVDGYTKEWVFSHEG